MNEKNFFDPEANEPKQERDSQVRPDSTQSEGKVSETGAPASQQLSELAQIRKEAQEAKRAAEQARFQADQQEIELEQQVEKIRNLRRGGWIAAVVLLAVLAGLIAYSYPLWQQHAEKIAQLPAIEQSLTAIGQRMNAAEEKLTAWTGEQNGLVKQMVSLEKQVSGNLQAARKQAEDLATQVRHTLRAEIVEQVGQIEARLSWLETTQDTDHIRMAKLEEKIGTMRQEMAQEIAQVREETKGNVARLDGRLDHNGLDLESVARRLDRNRVQFEVSKGQTRELVPGVSVTILGTDVSYQSARGWMRLVPEGRTLWLTGLGIHQAVRFYRQTGEEPYELVFTRVAKDSVAGYMVVPAEGSQAFAQSESPAPVLAMVE